MFNDDQYEFFPVASWERHIQRMIDRRTPENAEVIDQNIAKIRAYPEYQENLRQYWAGQEWNLDPEDEEFLADYDFNKYYLPDTDSWVEPKDRARTSPYLNSEEQKKQQEKMDIAAIHSIQITD